MSTFLQSRTGGCRVTRAPDAGAKGQGIYEEASVPQSELGEVRIVGERVFKYAKNGGSALAAGKICQAAVGAANHLNIAVAVAAPAGSTQITVTLGATAAAANAYAEGYLTVNDAAGEGQTYRIKSHPAALASASLVVTLYDEIVTALTTSSEVTLTANLYNGVVIAPNAALTAPFVGVPLIPVTASYYFWLQTAGPAAVLTQGTVVVGKPVGLGGTADGAIGPVSLSGGAEDVGPIAGHCIRVNASTEYSLINLAL